MCSTLDGARLCSGGLPDSVRHHGLLPAGGGAGLHGPLRKRQDQPAVHHWRPRAEVQGPRLHFLACRRGCNQKQFLRLQLDERLCIESHGCSSVIFTAFT